MGRRRITVSDDAEILVHWRAGRRIREIARSLGYARNTVRERIATAQAAGFTQRGSSLSAAEWRAALAATALERGDGQRRFPAQSKIEPLREQVTLALKASTAATVWQRLHDAGELDVGRRTFQRYVQEQIRPVDPARLTVLLPAPVFGEAMELDYGRLGMWTDPLGGRSRTVWAFVATLRASNTHFVRPVLQMDQRAWITCHREAVSFFGGVPRRWICDNLKSGVLGADLYDPQLNRGYRELAEHAGALIDPARAVHPKDKPRVERAMPYVRDSFWSGRSFASFEAIVAAALTWCRDVAPARRHPRLGQSAWARSSPSESARRCCRCRSPRSRSSSGGRRRSTPTAMWRSSGSCTRCPGRTWARRSRCDWASGWCSCSTEVSS